jgi:hypothetical protein
MRAFLRRRRWWLLAAGFLLAAFIAALFVARNPDDGSKQVWEMVQLGMTRGQLDEILARIPPVRDPAKPVFDNSY